MSNLLFKLNSSRIFQFIVITIIILNAITLGVSTYELNAYIANSIKILDYLITIFFVIEILIRFIGEPKKINFFKNGWNIFDTLIVLVSLIPIPNNSSFLLLRLLRVFRVLRLISAIPELKKIIEALIDLIKRVSYVGIIAFYYTLYLCNNWIYALCKSYS